MFFSMQDREENKMNLINITDRKGGILLSTKKRRHFPVCAIKRISSCSPCPKLHRGQRASMTVEACLVLPLFLFAFLNIISIVEIYRLQGNMSAAMHDTARQMAVYGYEYRQIRDRKSVV